MALGDESAANLNRRELLKRSLGVAAGALLFGEATSFAAAPATSPSRFRVAHITDAHVHPGRGAPDGLRQCFRHALTNFAPDLVVAGGDQIVDALEHPADSVQTYFECWHSAVKDACPNVPIAYVIGNHDIWGWADAKKSGTTGAEPNYGKAWPLAQFGLDKPYYSMDRGGWRIIVLDSVQFDGSGSYVAQLDEPQFQWLEAELRRTDATMPVCIFSHIPIIGFCPLMFDEKSPTTMSRFPKPRWILSRALMHVDARRIKDLFKQHPNVKLCVSGHIHLMDKVEYLGVAYVSNPAVSAAWWTGPMQEFDNGYGIIDLFADGTFATQTSTFGWKVPTA